MINIGKRTIVQNIRDLWPTEPMFSAWLATEPGCELLSADLGLDIENLRCEVRQTNFPCDLVGNLAGDESHRVIIENQYGRTNHDHLGKLLTHASVNQAMTAIWVTEHVADEHRQAIDWLNNVTPEHVNFYLVRISAIRIGDSLPAPQLDVVCRPNQFTKVRNAQKSASEAALHEWRRESWQTIHDYLETRPLPFRLQSPSIDHYSVVTCGRSGFHFAMMLQQRTRTCEVELYIDVPWKHAAFDQLEEHRTEVEAQCNAHLIWKRLPHRKAARIVWNLKVDPTGEGGAERAAEAFAKALPIFYTIFQPIVASLVMPTSSESDGQEEFDESSD